MGDRGRNAPRQVNELSGRRQLGLELIRRELQHRRQAAGDILPLGRRNQVGRREDGEDRRVRHEQGAIAVEDIATHSGQRHGVVVVGGGQSRHVAMPQDLPVGEPPQQHEIGAEHQRHQGEDAATRLELLNATGSHGRSPVQPIERRVSGRLSSPRAVGR